MTTVSIQQIMDQNDEKQIMEMIVRLGTRAVHFSNGELNVMLANAIAIQMLRSYLDGTLVNVCNSAGIDLKETPAVEGVGYDTTLSFARRH